MLTPKRVKYRKQQKGRMKGIARRGNVVSFGDFVSRPQSPAGLLPGRLKLPGLP